MQVPGQNWRLSTTSGASVVVVVVLVVGALVEAVVVGRGGRVVGFAGLAGASDLSPLVELLAGRSKTASAKLLRMGPASKDVNGLLNGLTGLAVGLGADPVATCLVLESQQTEPRSHKFGGLLMTIEGLVQKADINPGKQTPGQRVSGALVMTGRAVVVVGRAVVVVVVVVDPVRKLVEFCYVKSEQDEHLCRFECNFN